MAERKKTQMSLLMLFIVLCYVGVPLVSAETDSEDVAALRSLMQKWQNVPPSWGKTDDPCSLPWEGVSCTGSRVITLELSSMNFVGILDGDIGQLSELKSLDLSYNRNLTGPLSPRIGELKKLNFLVLAGCGFSGTIPIEIGDLAELSMLDLSINSFGGSIPPSLGKLSKLYWLNLSNNSLVGSIPISTDFTPGLDSLLNVKYFYLQNNWLSGVIPEKLFSTQMVLIHLVLDGNNLSGVIPNTLGLVSTLEIIRLKRNSLSGTVPSSLNNITGLAELDLAYNNLVGPVPDLTPMNNLNYVDLSNNLFSPSEAPRWFSTMQSLTDLVMENTSLQGPIPQTLFSLPLLQRVMLRDNQFNGTLDMGESIGQQLQLVDLQNNKISSMRLGFSYNNITLMLAGNPVCGVRSNAAYCNPSPAAKEALLH